MDEFSVAKMRAVGWLSSYGVLGRGKDRKYIAAVRQGETFRPLVRLHPHFDRAQDALQYATKVRRRLVALMLLEEAARREREAHERSDSV